MAFNWWMGKQIMVYPYDEIQLDNKKTTSNTCNTEG